MGLLDQDTLIMQQVTAFMSNNIDILDEAGQSVGFVQTEDGLLARMIKGNRQLSISDADKNPILLIKDPLNLVRDAFNLENPDASSFAHIRKKITLVTDKMDIRLTDGSVIMMKGNLVGLDFDFEVDGQVIATVNRKWAGIARGMLGHSKYKISFEPGTAPDLRKAVIGGCVVLDLIRSKGKKEARGRGQT